MRPIERVTMAITLISRLTTVIDRETEHLRKFEVDRLERLQDEKASLAAAYDVEMQTLRRDPEILGSLDMAVRENLADAVRSLRAASRRNTDAIDAARHVVDKIVQRIGRHLDRDSNGGTGYHAGAGRVISVAFNQQV